MELLFLGTSAGVPSKERSTSCIALRDGQDIALLDCGEGSQRQIMASPFSFMKIRCILITHLHGDHVFGLPGLLQTMGMSDRKAPLSVYGPKGLRSFVDNTMSATEGEALYPLEISELEGGESFQCGTFSISCFPTDHGMSSLGYVVRLPDRPGRLDHDKALSLGIADGPEMAELKVGRTVRGVRPEDVVGPAIKGFSVAYTGDTKPCPNTVENVRGVDILIHEATYMDSEARNASEHNHSTASQAAAIAKDANVSRLIMTHISHRYDDRNALADEARRTFSESYVADDLTLFTATRDSFSYRTVRPA